MAFLTETVRKFTSLLAAPGSFEVLALSGTTTLADEAGQFLRIDPDGAARAVTLPLGPLEPGRFLVMINVGTSSEDITVNSTLATVTPGDLAIFYVNDSRQWALWGLNADGWS